VGTRFSLGALSRHRHRRCITAVRKVKRASVSARLGKYLTLALRAVYFAARKSRVPHSKIVRRRLLRQSWLPAR
jgi:hypothetical protein